MVGVEVRWGFSAICNWFCEGRSTRLWREVSPMYCSSGTGISEESEICVSRGPYTPVAA